MSQPQRTQRIRKALLAWYARHARDLPWRRTADPYAIWVAEIMLQQTQAATAGPYFRRFLRRFPDVQALARAPLDAVLKLWEGLGYYGRARNLHRAAQHVTRDLGGALPQTASQLRKLPGIGRYTAGAIASIAFGRDEPVLDGNVVRALCRMFRVRDNPRQSRVKERLWRLAARLLPPGEAGRFNQAMMDLGATVCTPRAPRCDACPLEAVCDARRHGDENSLPVRARPRPVPHHDVAVAVIRKRGRILIARRKPEGFLGGLWEFPGGKCPEGEPLEACLLREVREELAIRVRVVRPLATARHAYSHFRVTLHAFECRHLSGTARPLQSAALKWVTLGQIDRYAFPRGTHKIIAALRHDPDAG